ncbi:MAG: hypothetical protein ACYC7H_13855, partial [Chloroflexota bacterium]
RRVAEGFVRSDGEVPQNSAVRLVTMGEKTAVQDVSLDADQAGTILLPPSKPGETRTLVVAAMAPLTTERASIQLSLQRLAPPGATPAPSPRLITTATPLPY